MAAENIYPRTGPTRGFLYWFTSQESRRDKPAEVTAGTYQRSLLKVQWIYRPKKGLDPRTEDFLRKRLTGYQHHGTCCWCRQPCESRKVWHTQCVKAMFAAKGLVVDVYKKALIPLAPCDECGLAHDQADKDGRWPEVDHREALSVAWECRRLGRRRWWHAWTLGNLRWLCHSCHREKTALDRRTLAGLRKEQVYVGLG